MEFASDADRAYANGPFIPGAAEFIASWPQKARAFRAEMQASNQAQLGLPYGDAERQKFDLFLPKGPAKGLFFFIHGGFWLAFGREDWSHLAKGAIARGWACAMPSYTLAPNARISEMTQEMAAALRQARQSFDALNPDHHVKPTVLAGHSAGGQLAARLACRDFSASALDHTAEIARVVAISPLADLAPLLPTQMNLKLGLDTAECASESPAQLLPRRGIETHVWVGGQERPAFLWQARLLAENWGCAWTVAPDLHHFNVCDALEAPQSALLNTCLGADA